MCTVSWIHRDEEYQLFSNRDERLSRAAALGPRIQARDGVQFLAPVDGAFGGTWISANEFGVSMCLLNGAGGGGVSSRGLLLLDLISASSLNEVEDGFHRLDLSPYAPFVLAVLEPGRNTAVLEWSGRTKSAGLARPPLASSSLDHAGAQTLRRTELDRRVAAAGTLDEDVLHDFHGSHAGGPSAWSPCMHRADAGTVSFSRVRVTKSHVELFYTPAAPCRRVPGTTFRLGRRR